MDYFAGLDISMDETHVCVLDREGVVKSLSAHAVRSLITARKKLVGQRVTLENQIRGLAIIGVRLQAPAARSPGTAAADVAGGEAGPRISQTGGRACAKEGYAFRPSSDSAQLHSPTANVTEAMQCLGERAA
jgi:hypothetical protein